LLRQLGVERRLMVGHDRGPAPDLVSGEERDHQPEGGQQLAADPQHGAHHPAPAAPGRSGR
jgi:hypothetical protein